MLGHLSSREDVHKELSLGFEPSANLLHEELVVFHVFKHFDGNDSVGGAVQLLGKVKTGNVSSEHLHVSQAAALGRGEDKLFLAGAVGDGRDAGVGVLLRHEQGDRAPAAAQVDDAHAVCQARALAVHFEHGNLAFLQRRVLCGPVPRRVLQMRPQNELIKRVGHLVMLLIRLDLRHGDWHRFDVGDEAHRLLRSLLGTQIPHALQTEPHLAANKIANQNVRNKVVLDNREKQRLQLL